MLWNPGKPVVFGGPSLAHLSALHRACIELLPPVRRGDVRPLLERENPGTVLLVDGVFSSSLAVTPTECRDLIDHGWTVIGAASMGALRASELWSVGMVGIGQIFSLYRLGILRSDADVAVAMNPDTHHELTASTVHVRAILGRLVQHGEIERGFASCLLDAAQRIHFLERTWRRCVDAWTELGMAAPQVEMVRNLARDPRCHPKVQDAHLAVRTVLADLWVEEGG